MRRKLLNALAALALIIGGGAAPASAALSNPSWIPVTTAYTNFPAASSAAVVVKIAPGTLGSIINLNTTAQTATFTCYDNSATNSGQVLWAGVLAASQVVTLNISTKFGVTCSASAATLSGNGILVTSN